MKKYLSLVCLLMAIALILCGCADPQKNIIDDNGDDETMKKQLSLVVGDSYDFSQMGYAAQSIEGTACYLVDDTVTAFAEGTDEVLVTDKSLNEVIYEITVYKTAAQLGANYTIDRGRFAGKRVVVFGASITDGCLLDKAKPTNYEDMYITKLCRYLGMTTDPTDLENCNFSCGGTTLTYGLRHNYGISGVERIDSEYSFSDGGRVRDPRPNVLKADWCVIAYGGNDFAENVLAGTANDSPSKAQDATTIGGGLYYMIHKVWELNPRVKILVLSPNYKRADGKDLIFSEDKVDIINAVTSETIRDYGKVMKEVSDKYGAKFIDMYPIFNYETYGRSDADQYTLDGVHPNAAGHEVIYQYLLKVIEQTNG